MEAWERTLLGMSGSGFLRSFWWMVELFSPQSIPKLTRRATRPADRQVVEWRSGEPLPWEALRAPAPIRGEPRVWRHTAYLGVYRLEDTYELLHRVFSDDADAYDERPRHESACAGVVINHTGRLVADSAVLSSALWAAGRAHKPGPKDPRWMEGFERAAENFVDAVDRFEGRRRDTTGDEQATPYDADALVALLKIAHMSTGIDGIEALQPLATERVVIDSVAVSARRADEQPDTDFLNSFFPDDLALVREQWSPLRTTSQSRTSRTKSPLWRPLIDTWRGQADYFGAIATEVLRETTGTDETTTGDAPVAWGLVAAKPGILETIFSFGCAVRDWRDQLKPLAEKLDAAEARENALIERQPDPHRTLGGSATFIGRRARSHPDAQNAYRTARSVRT
jgi:hypothetical protein